jgi:hypothetical protein
VFGTPDATRGGGRLLFFEPIKEFAKKMQAHNSFFSNTLQQSAQNIKKHEAFFWAINSSAWYGSREHAVENAVQVRRLDRA